LFGTKEEKKRNRIEKNNNNNNNKIRKTTCIRPLIEELNEEIMHAKKNIEEEKRKRK
jgi:hypothetical protein